MSNQANREQKENKSLKNRQGSGSDYHRKHAGQIEGYGEPHPTTADLMSNTENNVQ